MSYILIFIAATTIILLLGLITMASGDALSRKYGTKLMAARIIMQATVILSLLSLYFISR